MYPILSLSCTRVLSRAIPREDLSLDTLDFIACSVGFIEPALRLCLGISSSGVTSTKNSFRVANAGKKTHLVL